MTENTDLEAPPVALSNLFKSKHQNALAQVEAKLEAARRQHEELLAQQPAAALADALAEDGAAEKLAQLQADIKASEERLRLLQLASEEAGRREAERRRLARIAADKSRVNALRQHLARLTTAAAAYERATVEQLQAWQAMNDASRRAQRLLLAPEDAAGGELIGHARLRAYCESELERLSYPQHPTEIRHPLPGAKVGYWNAEERPKPLVEVLQSHVAWLLGETEKMGEYKANQGHLTPQPDNTDGMVPDAAD